MREHVDIHANSNVWKCQSILYIVMISYEQNTLLTYNWVRKKWYPKVKKNEGNRPYSACSVWKLSARKRSAWKCIAIMSKRMMERITSQADADNVKSVGLCKKGFGKITIVPSILLLIFTIWWKRSARKRSAWKSIVPSSAKRLWRESPCKQMIHVMLCSMPFSCTKNQR